MHALAYIVIDNHSLLMILFLSVQQSLLHRRQDSAADKLSMPREDAKRGAVRLATDQTHIFDRVSVSKVAECTADVRPQSTARFCLGSFNRGAAFASLLLSGFVVGFVLRVSRPLLPPPPIAPAPQWPLPPSVLLLPQLQPILPPAPSP